MALSEKQERFVQEYLVDLNAKQAYIRAGYKTKAATACASRLLANANVRARVDTLLAERSRRVGVSQDRVVLELARLAFLDPTNLVDTETGGLKSDASADDRAAIAAVRVKTFPVLDGEGVEREIRFPDKIKALELLGKHLGMFTDNVNVHMDLPQIVYDIGPGDSDG